MLWLADLLLGLHALIILFVALLPVAVLVGGQRRWSWVRKPWPRLIHLGLIAFITTQAWLGELCPLTVWEHQLRTAAGHPGYGEQGLIADLLHTTLFFSLPTHVFAVIYSAFALIVLLGFWFVPIRRTPPRQIEGS